MQSRKGVLKLKRASFDHSLLLVDLVVNLRQVERDTYNVKRAPTKLKGVPAKYKCYKGPLQSREGSAKLKGTSLDHSCLWT